MKKVKQFWNCLKNYINIIRTWIKKFTIIFIIIWVLIPGSSLWSVWAIDKFLPIPISVKSSISLAVLRINQNILEFNILLANPYIDYEEEKEFPSPTTQYNL